jgi:ABC-type bacteriocin/lantibiotic exporter with double-glycine peptidase domain
MDGLNIHSILLSFIENNLVVFLFYLLVTLFLYPLHYIYIPEYYGKVINSFKDKNQSVFLENVKWLLYIYIVFWITEFILLFLQYKIIPTFSEYATGALFEYILDHYQFDFENIHTGEILSKIIRMPSILFEYLEVFCIDFLKEFFVLVTAIYKYYYISNTAFLTYIFFVVINYLYIYVMFKIFFNYGLTQNDLQDKMYEMLVDCFNNLESVYSFNQVPQEKKRFYEVYFKGYKEQNERSWLLYMYGDIVWGFVTICLFISMNYILYSEYKKKVITAEVLISTFIITFSIIRLYEKAEHSSHRMAEVFSKIKDTEDFFNDIQVSDREDGDKHFKHGDICFRNIYHKYKETYVLENVSIEVKKGEKVAFVGQIGSGKSTLVKLLLGYQPIEMGDITIGGISVKEISSEQLHDEIFYIPQKPKLFNRTLYENIVYGLKKPPTHQEILKTLHDLDLDDVAKVFDVKMNEPCGIMGNSLSGGQRQMVWLLRSFYRSSRILVLDEPTASLDPENKKIMIRIIQKMSIGKTVIIVSHDEIDDSFRKITLRQGRLVESTYFS